MQRNSIYDPKQPRQNEQPQDRAPTRQQPSNSRLVANAPPTTQIVNNRPSGGVVLSGGMQAARSPDHLRKKELIVKLNYRKRKVSEIMTAPRITRSQAKKNSQATQNNPEATSGVQIQTERQPPAKRRKPNSNLGKQEHSRGYEAVNKASDVTSNAACLVKTSPRKAVMVSQRDGAAPGLAQSSAKVLPNLQQPPVSPRKKKTAQSPSVASPSMPVAPARLNKSSASTRTASPKKPATSSRSTQRKKPIETPQVKSMASSSTLELPSSPSKAASRRRPRPTLTMLVTPDQATLEAMERDDPLLF